jgi:hypothetical protein
MVFIIEGIEAGRWVTLNEFEDNGALVEKLTFSSDGKQLLALVRGEIGKSTKTMALVFSTDQFPKDRLERKYNKKPIRINPAEIVLKEWQPEFRVKDAAFAMQSTMAVICTYYIQDRAGIQFLKKTGPTWGVWGKLHPIRLFPRHDTRQWRGFGITGISL